MGIKVLEDDKKFFTPYYAVPLVNEKTLEKHPELKDVFNLLAGKIDEETIINLNYEVDVLGKSPEEVAHKFLVDSKLI
jgi:osmoprotectant transport system permease protein